MEYKNLRMSLLVKSMLRITIAVYVGFGLVLTVFQKNFIYAPSDQDFGVCPGFADSERLDLNGTRVYYKENNQRNVVVLYHGNGGSACDRAYWREYLDPIDTSYVIVEYAGYSRDDEESSKERIMQDVENVHAFLRDRHFTNVTVAGESLGTALAVYHSTLGDTERLLLVSPFYSLNSIAQELYPMYPIAFLSTQNFDSSLWMRTTQARKIMMIHGAEDEMHPILESRKLFSETGVAEKKFVEVAGAHHNDIYDFDETVRSIRGFLSE